MDVWNLKGGQLKILKQNEIEEIHQRALDVLQQVGCFMDHEEALALFEKHGAVVDQSTRIVKIPRNMVEEALRLSPSSILLAARDPEKDIHAEGDRVYFGPGTLPIKVRDLETGQIRMGTYKRLRKFFPADRCPGVCSLFQRNDDALRRQSESWRTLHGKGRIQ